MIRSAIYSVPNLFVELVKLCASGFNEFLDKNGPYMAAAISYYSLLSMFPLLLGLLSLFGYLLGSSEFEQRLFSELPKEIPVGADVLTQFFNFLQSTKAVSGLVASIGLLWASLAVFGAIRKSINLIWGIQKTRPFLQERLMDISLMLGASLLLVLSVFATTFEGFFQEILHLLFRGGGPSVNLFWRALSVTVPPILVYITFLILYTWLPNTRVRLRASWLPALGAAAAFSIATVVFVAWLKRFPGYHNIYGTFSAVIALILWIYISSIIMLVGAMMTARYAAFLAAADQKRHLSGLAQSLERVRARPVLLAPSNSPGAGSRGSA